MHGTYDIIKHLLNKCAFYNLQETDNINTLQTDQLKTFKITLSLQTCR